MLKGYTSLYALYVLYKRLLRLHRCLIPNFCWNFSETFIIYISKIRYVVNNSKVNKYFRYARGVRGVSLKSLLVEYVNYIKIKLKSNIH